ncbi:hypothetical protein GCK32_003059 [Trichostrongylus colubriformis]|uniref:Uncharacterized protein n=1 Tax=Trichostrongylus colubriformis TaxID=6319 RepID=A0AAN8FF36_TRICO
MVLAETRTNLSCAIRFSEPPVSAQARDELYDLVRRFMRTNWSEAVSPMKVMNLTSRIKDWLTDRVNDFNNYATNTASAKRRMGRVFNVSCAALAALATMHDDTTVRWVTFTQPPGTMCPIRFDFVLRDMPHEAGRARGRMVDFWITGADHTTRMRVDSTFLDMDSRKLSVRVAGFTWNHVALVGLLSEHGQTQGDRRVIIGYVRLGKLTKSADAANEAVSRMLHNVECVEVGTVGHHILDNVYRKHPQTPPPLPTEGSQPPLPNLPDTFRSNQQLITLTQDQREALAPAMAGHPIAGINAAFGIGKTFLASVIAGLLIQAGEGPVIVTTTTNNGAAHFTNTLLAIEEFRSLRLLRYISETAFLDESPTTPADIHEIFESLEDQYDSVLNAEKRLLCSRFSMSNTPATPIAP